MAREFKRIAEFRHCFGQPVNPVDQVDPRMIAKCTGNFLVKIRLAKNIPGVLPMFGLKITVSYQGIKKMCNRC